MPKFTSVIALVLLSFLPVWAQQKGKGGDPGITPNTLIDNPDVRIGRTEIAPGATRSMHAHSDVAFHLFIPLSGTLVLTIGDDPPVEAKIGQAYYIKAGTQHGFKNTGTTLARVIEVFVKPK